MKVGEMVMFKRRLASAMLWVILCQPANSAPISIFTGLGNSFIPGGALSFDVVLPNVSNLGAYNIDLLLESTRGNAGVDFYFDVAATAPATSHYVFPSSVNYFDAANVDASLRHRLTLSDFDFAGADVVAGVNHVVAHVLVRTSPDLFALLTLSVDANALILDTPAVTPTPVDGFAALVSDIVASGPVRLVPVPEPPTGLLAIGVAIAAMLRRPFLLSRNRRRYLRSR
jgi:hypothetical protein